MGCLRDHLPPEAVAAARGILRVGPTFAGMDLPGDLPVVESGPALDAPELPMFVAGLEKRCAHASGPSPDMPSPGELPPHRLSSLFITHVDASDGAAPDLLGYSTSLSGDTLAAGAPWENNGGNLNHGSVRTFGIDRVFNDTT